MSQIFLWNHLYFFALFAHLENSIDKHYPKLKSFRNVFLSVHYAYQWPIYIVVWLNDRKPHVNSKVLKVWAVGSCIAKIDYNVKILPSSNNVQYVCYGFWWFYPEFLYVIDVICIWYTIHVILYLIYYTCNIVSDI